MSEGCRGYVCAYALLSSAMAFFGVMTTYGTKGVINGANGGDIDLLKKSAVYLLALLLVQVILKHVSLKQFFKKIMRAFHAITAARCSTA